MYIKRFLFRERERKHKSKCVCTSLIFFFGTEYCTGRQI